MLDKIRERFLVYHSSEDQGEPAGPDELPAIPRIVPVQRERLNGLPAVANDLESWEMQIKMNLCTIILKNI